MFKIFLQESCLYIPRLRFYISMNDVIAMVTLRTQLDYRDMNHPHFNVNIFFLDAKCKEKYQEKQRKLFASTIRNV